MKTEKSIQKQSWDNLLSPPLDPWDTLRTADVGNVVLGKGLTNCIFEREFLNSMLNSAETQNEQVTIFIVLLNEKLRLAISWDKAKDTL